MVSARSANRHGGKEVDPRDRVTPSVLSLVTRELWEEEERVVKKALKKLGNLCNSDVSEEAEKIRQEVCLLGGPLSIIKTTDRFPHSSQIQVLACTDLSILLYSHEMALHLVVRSGGVQSVIDGMQRFPNDEMVQESGCSFLASLTEKSVVSAKNVADSGGISAIASAVENHPDNGLVQEYACEAVLNMACSGREHAHHLVHGGGLSVLIHALSSKCGEEDVTTKCYACKALRELARAGSDLQREIILSGGLAALGRAVQHHPLDADVRHEVGGLLAAFAKVLDSKIPL